MPVEIEGLQREIDGARPRSGWRRSALLLHAMAEGDRRWMLGRLSSSQRDVLEGLLRELRSMDFPIDATLLQEALREDASPALSPLATSAGRESLAALSGDQAWRLLGHEPDGLVALVLAAGPWSWQAGFLDHAGAHRAAALQRAADGKTGPATPALRDAVLSAVGRAARSLR